MNNFKNDETMAKIELEIEGKKVTHEISDRFELIINDQYKINIKKLLSVILMAEPIDFTRALDDVIFSIAQTGAFILRNLKEEDFYFFPHHSDIYYLKLIADAFREMEEI